MQRDISHMTHIKMHSKGTNGQRQQTQRAGPCTDLSLNGGKGEEEGLWNIRGGILAL